MQGNFEFQIPRLEYKADMSKSKVALEKRLHRPGIKPGPPAWQASILPLNQRCIYGEFG